MHQNGASFWLFYSDARRLKWPVRGWDEGFRALSHFALEGFWDERAEQPMINLTVTN